MSEIKPCLFCEFPEPALETEQIGYHVECGECAAQGSYSFDEAEAIAIWNAAPRKGDTAALTAALEQAKEREKKLLMCHKEIVDLLQQCDEENPCDMVLVQDLADILNKHFLCEKEEEDDDE